MADISKIKIPTASGFTTYDIKDAVAREAIAGGIAFIVAWDGASVPVPANIPNGVVVTYQDNTYTGTLSAETTGTGTHAQAGAFYLVHASHTQAKDAYAEYVPVGTAGSKYWEKIGDTEINFDDLGELAFKDGVTVTLDKKTNTVLGTGATFKATTSNVSFSGGTTDSVLGADTTFTNGTSNVTFGALTSHTDEVYGTGTTFSVANTGVTVTPDNTYLKATIGNVAIGNDSTGSAITALGDPSTANFVKSYPGATSKLATTKITPTNGTVSIPNVTAVTPITATNTVFGTDKTASYATAGTAIDVAKAGSQTSVASGALGTETATRTANTPMWGATVTDEVLSFTFKPISTKNIIPAVSNGSITPYTFDDVAVPTVSSNQTATSSAVTLGTAISAAKVGTELTVATGSLSSTETTGATVMTGLGTAVVEAGVTGYASPSTETFTKSVKVTTQPTIGLSKSDTTSTGAVQLVEGITSAALTSGTVNASTGDKVNAIISMPTATAAAQKITVGSNDTVTVVKTIGTATAAAQTISVNSADSVTVLNNTTGVNVSYT